MPAPTRLLTPRAKLHSRVAIILPGSKRENSDIGRDFVSVNDSKFGVSPRAKVVYHYNIMRTAVRNLQSADRSEGQVAGCCSSDNRNSMTMSVSCSAGNGTGITAVMQIIVDRVLCPLDTSSPVRRTGLIAIHWNSLVGWYVKSPCTEM